MKLTIERAALLKSLAHVQSVVERRNTIPILSNVLLEAAGGKLSLTATDMDLTIVEEVEAEIGAEGATTAPAHTLYDIVRKLPDGSQIEIAMAGENGQMTLSAGRSTFTLTTLPREDFPASTQGELPQNFKVPATELRNLVDRTRFAISTEETRYYLNGIYLHAAESGGVPVLRAVATDGHRLARFEMPLPDGAKGMPGVIIPRKTVGEVRKLLEEADDSVTIALSETRIQFSFNSTILTSKLIDGTFPDYERVIPSGNDKAMEVDRKSFREAVDRVSTISSEKSRAVKLALSDSMLVLSATSAENGSAVEEIEVGFSGEGLEIGFNSKYLLDIAEQIEGGEALFHFSDAASPTIVRDAGDESALYVLMPMRV
ncbi:DNA polymerase III subunit beta [Limibacillus halophilus]